MEFITLFAIAVVVVIGVFCFMDLLFVLIEANKSRITHFVGEYL